MLLELGTVIAQPGSVLPFSQTLDFSDMVFGGSCPATEPVRVVGQVRNEAGVLQLTAAIDTDLHCVCDRCLDSFVRPFHLDFEAVLEEELMDETHEDEVTFALKDRAADLDEILTTAFVLNMDSKFLCRPDCRGLCPTCGKNLNEGPCDCTPEPDPRWAALQQLLKDKE